MPDYRHELIAYAIEIGVLRFGEFTLKSGRVSPYFFNAGLFDSGARLDRLASAYAHRIVDWGLEVDCLFGPAYKGIPLAAAMSMALVRDHGLDLPYSYNRKEAKDHGEGGIIVGRALSGRVLIVDDVITAGTSVRESVELIRAAGAEPAGVLIALDRQERGIGERSAVQEVREDLGLPVASIVGLDDLIAFLERGGSADSDSLAVMRNYRVRYGV